MLSAMAGMPEVQGQAFRVDIDRWTTQDQLSPPPSDAVLFIGSSSIRRWDHLARDFSDYDIIQRGFGGSQFSDVNRYINDIVLPYRPAAIVVFEGTNDVAGGKSPQVVFDDFKSFTDLVHSSQPGTPIIFIGITPTPSRWDCCETASAEVNSLIQAHSGTEPSIHYIDTPSYFLGLDPPRGREFTSLFGDRLHLTEEGYDVWTSIIRPELEAVRPSQKSFTPNPLAPDVGSRLLFDFGPANSSDGDPTVGPDANGNIWNNWHSAEGEVSILAGEHLGNLVTTNGADTGINLTITGGFSSNGKLNGGLFAPNRDALGDLAIETATEDYFFSTNDDTPGGFMLSHLDPGRSYEFRFFASRNATQTRTTEYNVFGDNSGSAQLQTSGRDVGSDGAYDGNDATIAVVEGIRPDAFGQVFVDVQRVSGSYAYIGAMEVVVVPEPSSLALAFVGLVALAARRGRNLR